LLCQGLANAHCWLVQYNEIGEAPTSPWIEPYYAMVQDGGAPATGLAANFRFTDWSIPAQDTCHLYIDNALVNMQDCQLYGGLMVDTSMAAWSMTNSVLDRVYFFLQPGGWNGLPAPDAPLLRNNLFYGGTLEIDPTYQTNALVRDNLFDRTTIMFDTNMFDTNGWAYEGGHNAFITNGIATNYARLQPEFASDIVLSNPITYYVGPLGAWYQGATTNPLIHSGSTNANLVDMYHYTVSTNLVSGLEVPEGTNFVSIGMHFVAVDQYGNPLNTSGSGPDYLLDGNGNGVVDSGEIGWNITGDLGLKVLITRPKNNSVVP
jgi:hypothetical protein